MIEVQGWKKMSITRELEVIGDMVRGRKFSMGAMGDVICAGLHT